MKVTEATTLVDLYTSACKLYQHAEDEKDINFYGDILKFVHLKLDTNQELTIHQEPDLLLLQECPQCGFDLASIKHPGNKQCPVCGYINPQGTPSK